MKKIPVIIVIAVIFAAQIISCDLFNDAVTSDGAVKEFNALDNKKGTFYTLKAKLLETGKYCTVWAETTAGVSSATAKKVADEYDTKIHLQMIDAFGIQNIKFDGYTFADTMAFADAAGDGDGKLCILLLDIKDNYKKGVNSSYIAGYFYPYDVFPQTGSFSNRRDMIYIDTYPGMEYQNTAFTTLAHEMQHMMNFMSSFLYRIYETKTGNTIFPMDTWIDEGLSAAAEYVYSGHTLDKINWYNQNGDIESNIKSLIDKGNNFFVWGNREDENMYANLDDYSTVYLFFQWLRLQSGGTDIYKKIISSQYYNQSAITSVFKSDRHGNSYSDWDSILKTWLAANYINIPNSQYGYMNDSALSNLRIPAAVSINSTILLSPGEGVYSLMGNSFGMPSQGTNVRYASLDKTGVVFNYEAGNGRVLLTYNSDTTFNDDYSKGNPENGATTGFPIAASVTAVSNARSALPKAPYRTGISDLFRKPLAFNPEDFKIRNEE